MGADPGSGPGHPGPAGGPGRGARGGGGGLLGGGGQLAGAETDHLPGHGEAVRREGGAGRGPHLVRDRRAGPDRDGRRGGVAGGIKKIEPQRSQRTQRGTEESLCLLPLCSLCPL